MWLLSACTWTALAGAALVAAPGGRGVSALYRTPQPRRREAVGRSRWAWATVAGLSVGAVLGWPWGVPAAVGAGWWVRRRMARGPWTSSARAADDRDWAQAAVLVAAAIESGLPSRQAAAAVGAVVGGGVGVRLTQAAAAAALGVPPEQAWAGLASPGAHGPATGGSNTSPVPADRFTSSAFARRFAALLIGCDVSGVPPVAGLRALAADARAAAAAAATDHVHRVAVRAVAPLGLCLLPAFVLVGVVPVAAGAFRGLGW